MTYQKMIGWMFFVLGAVLRPVTLSQLWFWFLTPLGFRPIGIAHAWGLLLFWFVCVRYGTERTNTEDEDDDESVLKGGVRCLMENVIPLGLGWVAKELMA